MAHRGPSSVLLILVLLLAAAYAPSAAAATGCSPKAGITGVSIQNFDNVPGAGNGNYLLRPSSGSPHVLVVASHGLGNTARAVCNLPGVQALAQSGALVVAMNYAGSGNDCDGLRYTADLGAAENLAAVALLKKSFSISTVILWGHSMGGHIVSLMAMQPGRLAPNYYLINDHGPTNLIELWATVAVASPGTGLLVQCSLDAAYGFMPTNVERYIEASPALNPAAWEGSQVDHAYLVYGAADRLVTPDHGQQLAPRLIKAGIPTDVYTAVFNEDGQLPTRDELLNEQKLPWANGHGGMGLDIAKKLVRGAGPAGPCPGPGALSTFSDGVMFESSILPIAGGGMVYAPCDP